jgi:DNA polymerase-3 subunit gamma/tau
LSYLVLARKWRPRQFNDVVGQKAITQTLKNAILSGRTAHAYLFSGQRGVGKTTTARILAKALNCQEGPTPKPCDVCTLCEEINKGSSIDVIEIDGASNNSVDDIRDLREKVHYIPAKGHYKVYIIDEVHMLSKPAFNALLKTLEEPPEHVVFILATTEAHKIPITILSRCQRYDFRRISSHDIYAYLNTLIEEEGGLKGEKEAALHLIAKIADGSLRDALSLIDQVMSYSGEGTTLQQILDLVSLVDYHIIGEMMIAVAEGKAREALICVEKVVDRGHDLKHFVEQILHYIRDTMILKMNEGDGTGLDLNFDEKKEMATIARLVSQEDLLRYFDILARAIERMRLSSQPRLILEMALIRLAELPKLESLTHLIQRLDLLEEVKVEGKEASLPEMIEAPHQNSLLGSDYAQKGPVQEKKLQNRPPEQNIFNWPDVVQQVKGKSITFGSVLEHLKIKHVEESNILELSLQEDNPFYWKMIEDQKNQAILHDALAHVTGNRIGVKWTLQNSHDFDVEKPTEKVENNSSPSSNAGLERSLDIVNREPIIQKAMEIFSAQIIKTHLAENQEGKDEGNAT